MCIFCLYYIKLIIIENMVGNIYIIGNYKCLYYRLCGWFVCKECLVLICFFESYDSVNYYLFIVKNKIVKLKGINLIFEFKKGLIYDFYIVN